MPSIRGPSFSSYLWARSPCALPPGSLIARNIEAHPGIHSQASVHHNKAPGPSLERSPKGRPWDQILGRTVPQCFAQPALPCRCPEVSKLSPQLSKSHMSMYHGLISKYIHQILSPPSYPRLQSYQSYLQWQSVLPQFKSNTSMVSNPWKVILSKVSHIPMQLSSCHRSLSSRSVV